ncbi:MAG: hydantoinase B/oxoprolinase family protein [Thermoplasmata archaeon]
MKRLKPTELEVMKHAFTAIPEQMGASLQRSAYSPNIKERKDESCALFTAKREMIAQAEHIPVHLGAMPNALENAVSNCAPGKNDQVILNDPYSGGTHLPDITLIKPVFVEEELVGYVVNRAHHSDVGGITPGSMPGQSKTLSEEGIIITPTLVIEDGEMNREVTEKLQRSRSAKERMGDLRAQIGANEKGAEEFEKAIEKYGMEKYRVFKEQIMGYSEKRTKKMIEELPDSTVSSEDLMEWDDGVKLRVEIGIHDDKLNFDFSGTQEQVEGNINAPAPVTYSAVYYVLRCLLSADVPVNNGCYMPLSIHIPEGTVLNPKPPAAVSAGNVETSQRVVELIFRAFEKVLPEKILAESQGTMNNLLIGNDDFTYYETIGGGAGASKEGPGESGVHVHMTNTKNTPLEVIENEYPLRITAYTLRRSSGGNGKNPGGDGIIREIKSLEDAEVSIQSERRTREPKGIMGGENGKTGKNIKISDNGEEEVDSKITFEIKEGEGVRIETPGGGGYGEP